jgi:hypothetical protein
VRCAEKLKKGRAKLKRFLLLAAVLIMAVGLTVGNVTAPSKTHSSPASAANANGFVQITLSQVPRRDRPVVHAASTRRRTCDRDLRFFANHSNAHFQRGTSRLVSLVRRNPSRAATRCEGWLSSGTVALMEITPGCSATQLITTADASVA